MSMVSYAAFLLLWLAAMVLSEKGAQEKFRRRIKDTPTTPACHYDFIKNGDWCYYNSWVGNYDSLPWKANYDYATEICRMMGGDLLSIHDASENLAMHKIANETLIGLRYNGYQFTWSDGTPFNFSAADPNFESLSGYLGYCAKIGVTYWENAECDTSELPYTCKMLPTLYPNTVCPDPSTLHLDAGTVSSPGYPLYYIGNSANCQYMIAAMNGRRIEITFNRYRMAYSSSGNDTIIVYEGLTTSSSLGRLDRNSAGEVVFTTRSMNRMLLTFASYGGNRGYWTATFRSV